MNVKLAALAVAAVVTTGSAVAAREGAPLVFPIPAGACHAYPCAIDGYGDSAAIASGIVIPAGAAASGMVQSQTLDGSTTTGEVLYSAYNADRTFLQTLWIEVMPSRGGYHVTLTTCRATPNPPCKV
jgi:hypothetical protein